MAPAAPPTLPIAGALSFSDVSADYAIPRAILAPHLLPPSRQQPTQHRQVPPPPAMHNPSVLHPVFFTENLQRRRSFGQPAVPVAVPPVPVPVPVPAPVPAPRHIHNPHQAPFMPSAPYQAHPAAFPLAPPAPPLPHASSPVAHGYIYRENTTWPIAQRARPVGVGTGSKL